MIYDRIEKALTSAIKLHNSGTNANESIVKVAREYELNPETINRVIEAFNTAKTKAYVKVAQDRSADFDIADKREVLKSVFSDNTNAEKEASIDEDFSSVVVEDLLNIDKNRKTASEDDAVTFSSVPLETRIKFAFQAIEEQNRQISEDRDIILSAREKFYQSIKSASDILSFSEEQDKFSSYISQVFNEHKDNVSAGKILKLVGKIANLDVNDFCEKISEFIPYTDDKFLEHIDNAISAEKEYSENINSYNALVKESIDKEIELRALLGKATGIDTEKTASCMLWSPGRGEIAGNSKFAEFSVDIISEYNSTIFYDSKKKQNRQKSAAEMMTPFSGFLDQLKENQKNLVSSTSASSSAPMAQKGYELKLKGIESPKQQQATRQELENIKREAILRELMMDEIISQQDPSDIENSYNALIQLAPNASLIKDVARSVLRQGTAQTIDPHFANSLVELENNLLKARNFDPNRPTK